MMANPGGNPKNLKHFKKGDDSRRNMAGGPKKLPDITELLVDLLNEQKNGKTTAQAIFDGLAARASKGDTKAAELILNRAYGKPKENEGQPTEMIIRVQRNS